MVLGLSVDPRIDHIRAQHDFADWAGELEGVLQQLAQGSQKQFAVAFDGLIDCRLTRRVRLQHVVFQLLDRTHGGIRKPDLTGQQSGDRALEQALVRRTQQGALRFGTVMQLGLEQDRDKACHHGLLDFQHLDTGLQCFLFLERHAVNFS